MESIAKTYFDGEFFNVKDTLECGQIFRFTPYQQGYLVFSCDKCAYCYNDQENAFIVTKTQDKEYFSNFFDIERDYSKITQSAIDTGIEILSISANLGKGIRILNQNAEETLFSFIISQNNNIPRIKKSIEKLCQGLGEKHVFDGVEYYGFPTAEKMSQAPLGFYKEIGLGYRAEYVKKLAEKIVQGYSISQLKSLSTEQLKKSLIGLYGVGPKVADCVSLFGFHRSDSFPVDTWIDKVYKEHFNGTITDRNKISKWFTDLFKENSGYYQQYLFYYKRSLEKQK